MGRFTYISCVLQGDYAFTAKVTLPKTTTYQKAVSLQVGLAAQAEAVTVEQSLLGRNFNSTRDLLKNR